MGARIGLAREPRRISLSFLGQGTIRAHGAGRGLVLETSVWLLKLNDVVSCSVHAVGIRFGLAKELRPSMKNAARPAAWHVYACSSDYV